MGLKKIKNILIILITALLLSAVSLAIIGNVGKKENDNSSAASAIYSIYDFDDLKQFRQSIIDGNNYDNRVVNLYADIDMSAGSWDFELSGVFYGTFNGNNHCLYNFSGSSPIFYWVHEGVVRDLSLYANNSSAGLISRLDVGSEPDSAKVINCSLFGSVKFPGKLVYGGIVSRCYGAEIINCQNYANIDGGESSRVGGIVGYAENGHDGGSRIICCINHGSVKGSSEVGGIVGRLEDSSVMFTSQILNCINLGKISGNEYIGGITGRNYHDSAQIYRCYNSQNSGVKGAGVGGSKVGKDFTNGDFYCLTTSEINSAAGVRSYASDSSKWDTNKEWESDNTWFCDSSNSYWSNISSSSNLNEGYPYIKSSTLTVTVNVNNSSYGNTGSFQIIRSDSISASGSSIRVNSSYNVYSASPKSSTNEYTYSFSSWSGIPSGAQYADFSITANFTRALRQYTVYIYVDSSANYGSLRKLGESSTQESIVINEVEYGSSISYSSDTLRITPPASGTGTVTQIEAVPDYDSSGVYTYSFDEWTIYPETSQVTRDLNIVSYKN